MRHAFFELNTLFWTYFTITFLGQKNKENAIKDQFLKTLPPREKEILNCTKFSELGSNKEFSLAVLGKKFNISPERVRQISEKSFAELKKILIKNKKYLELE